MLSSNLRIWNYNLFPNTETFHFYNVLGIREVSFPSSQSKILIYVNKPTKCLLKWLGGEFEQWCVADEQTPDNELQMALDWACGMGGANCSKIQPNQPCFNPNTVKDHASFAFNSYFQSFKHQGGSCFFKGAAIITELDPSKPHFYCLPYLICDSLPFW